MGTETGRLLAHLCLTVLQRQLPNVYCIQWPPKCTHTHMCEESADVWAIEHTHTHTHTHKGHRAQVERLNLYIFDIINSF